MNRAQTCSRAQKLKPVINRTYLLLVPEMCPLAAYRPLHTPTPSLYWAFTHAALSA